MTDSSPRLHYGGRTTADQAEEQVMYLYRKGVGPLSIAVKVGINARLVRRILASNGIENKTEPQCYRLNDQMLP